MPFVRLPRFALCLALLFTLAQSVRALQLGETRAQLVARHGPPNDEDHARNLATYFWDGWSAQLEFQGGAVRRITYKRDWYLQEEEIASLLEANGGGGHWTEISDPQEKSRLWARDDGAAASCMRFRPLNIVFESGVDTGNSSAGSKGVVPATPSPATSAAANSPAQPVAAAESSSAPSSRPTAPVPMVPEPTAGTVGEPKPIPEHQPVAVASATHGLATALVACALLTLAGTALYLFQKRPRPAGARPAVASGTVPPSPIADRLPELHKLSSDQLESLITATFRREGYRVELSAAAGSDHGLELTLRRDSETVLVQSRQAKYAQVAQSEVRDFGEAIAAVGVSRGIMVTTGEFTAEARRFAEGHGIELLDGMALAQRLADGTAPMKREMQTVAIQ